MLKKDIKSIISHSHHYGFIFSSSEIYNGINALYDYGPYGVMLKNNIKNYWWKAMVDINENIVGLDTSILMHPKTWKASGHLDTFNEPLIANKDSKQYYRADILISNFCDKLQEIINKEISNLKKCFGEKFKEKLDKNTKIAELRIKKEKILVRMNSALQQENFYEIKALIKELDIFDTKTGSKNWTDVQKFNTMFRVHIGLGKDLYLRPESAQGIFLNFLNVQKSTRLKIPFGIAQIGKAFRNEIIARQFIFRMREFEQMEMQFFVQPGQEIKWYEYWKNIRLRWHRTLGINREYYRFNDHDKLAHYAKTSTDIEFNFPFGFKELEGIHSRTDFDIKNHQKFSGKKLHYFDNSSSYIPYVIETSLGLDRMFLAVLYSSFQHEKLNNGDYRTVLKLPPALAPIKAAVFPLIRKNELSKFAKKIFQNLKYYYSILYEEKDSIGKRYRRQDAIGTPFCFTVDEHSLINNTVTVRYRDNMKQHRLSVNELNELLERETSITTLLKML